VQDDEVSDNDGAGLKETCDGVKWRCSHGGEDGWGCCGGMGDGLEEGGKRGSDCSIPSGYIDDGCKSQLPSRATERW
jgi:hypothetical protein